MARHFSPEEKSAAMTRLAENHGNIALTAVQLGIADRTLRDWRRQFWLEGKMPPPPPLPPPAVQPPAELPPFEDDLAAVNFMRRQMMDDLLAISLHLRQDFAVATPYQRMVIIPQLLDRLMKLDQHLKPYQMPDEEVEYIIVGAETFERRGTEGTVEFTVVNEDASAREIAAYAVKEQVETARRIGRNPQVVVRFWRKLFGKNGKDKELAWEGTLILSSVPSDQKLPL